MGQCGCGDYHPEFQFPGPDGSVYTLEIYDSCRYCETPMGVVVTHHRKLTDENDDYAVRELPLLPFTDLGDSLSASVPLVDPNCLLKVMEIEVEGCDVLMTSEVVGFIQDAMRATRSEGS